MEFWLSFNNKAEVLQLPVLPSEFSITKGTTVNTVNINDIGEIAIIGKGRLAEISLSSFFPAKQYSFCQYSNFPKPYDCVKRIEKWKDSGKPIRLIITETNINMACAIETFEYGERDGTGDVYFTISLKEYRLLNVNTSDVLNESAATKRPVEKQTPKTYQVKQGDSLYNIAKKLYGDGSKYTLLCEKNGIKDHKKIFAGQVLVV